jgi:hypothetical protein
VSYTPQVGDKIRQPSWIAGEYTRVTAVGQSHLFGVDVVSGVERPYLLDPSYGWELFVEPVVYPECWINIYRSRIGCEYSTQAMADQGADPGRLGVLHLRPDGTTEMETP